MKYDTLKALVNAKVYENTEQEITGGDMNNVLQSAIASLGAHYQMGGLVSPTDHITVGDEPVVFIATTPGTYTYFGSQVVADGEVALLVWSGTAWSKQTPDISTRTEVNQLGQDIDSVGQNYIPRCTYNSDGSISGDLDWFIGYDYIPVKNGDTIVWNPGSSNQGGRNCIIVYNSDKERIGYYTATAIERTFTLHDATAAFIRPSFYMDNLSSAKIIKNGVEVWSPAVREMGVALKEKQTDLALGFITGEKSLLYSVQNGTPGNFFNANCVVVRGRNTVVLSGIPNHKYRLKFNKTPHEGYNFYFSWGAYTTDSPTSFVNNRTRTTGWVEDKEFVLNSNEYGFAITIGEITEPSDSATFLPLRESDFSEGDIVIVDMTDSAFEKLREVIDTKLSSAAKYSAFSPIKGKYVTDSDNVKTIAPNSQTSYIEVPVESIDSRICVVGFTYRPSPGDASTYTSILFFDENDTLISKVYYSQDGIMSLEKPAGAVTCYIDVPVAHIDELSVFSDFGGGAVDITRYLGGTIMTWLSGTYNISFGEHSVTIGANGFSYVVNGIKYDITGSQDYSVDFSPSTARRYLCLDVQALIDGDRTFTDVLKVFDNSVPGENYVILLDFYYGTPQDGLLLQEYISTKQASDTIGSPIIVDYKTKGEDFAALFADAENAVSFLFFTDPHISRIGASFFASYMPMLKKIQQFYQSLPLDFVLSGGDWLNNSDTQTMACYKLGNIKQQLKTRLSPCYQMLGNHDTNYQGTSALSQDAINALIFNDYGKSYYRVERYNCALYIFDSGTDGRTVLSNYEKEQLSWFASALAAEQKDNIIIASHIIIEGSQGSSYLTPFSTAIEQIADAYNDRTTVTVGGVSYDFTGVTGSGKVRCFIGGHTHYDYVNTEEAIPIFVTTNTIDSSSLGSIYAEPRFDLILVDFAEGKLHAIRIGDGSDRTIDLAS